MVKQMDKRQYFIESLQTGGYEYLSWVIDAFTESELEVVKVNAEETREPKDFNPMQMVRLASDPENVYCADVMENTFTKLEDYKAGEPYLKFSDKITLEPNDLPNVKEKIDGYYGEALVNMVLLCYPFGDKIPYHPGRFDEGVITKAVAGKLKAYDPDVDPATRDRNFIYVDELVKHFDAVSSLEGWLLFCAPSVTIETMVPVPGVLELRDKLLKQHENELDNPAVVANIMTQLVDYEKAHLKDTEASGYYIKAKSYGVVRAKRFIMYGLEGGMGGKPALITKSLNEGWDMDKFSNMVDGFRSGSFARGKETAVGGEWVKHFQRLFQNVRVEGDDCGTKDTMAWHVTEYNHKRFNGLYHMVNGKAVLIDASETKDLVGKTIHVRSPMLCKQKAPHFCATCCGKAITASGNALNTPTSRVGSVFMGARMGAMHGKAAVTKRFDLQNAFS